MTHWNCSRCTLENPESALSCEACEAPRPSSRSSVVIVSCERCGRAIEPGSTSICVTGGPHRTGKQMAGWTCTQCTYENDASAEKCAMCDHPPPLTGSIAPSSQFVSAHNDTTWWSCDKCYARNPSTSASCLACAFDPEVPLWKPQESRAKTTTATTIHYNEIAKLNATLDLSSSSFFLPEHVTPPISPPSPPQSDENRTTHRALRRRFLNDGRMTLREQYLRASTRIAPVLFSASIDVVLIVSASTFSFSERFDLLHALSSACDIDPTIGVAFLTSGMRTLSKSKANRIKDKVRDARLEWRVFVDDATTTDLASPADLIQSHNPHLHQTISLETRKDLKDFFATSPKLREVMRDIFLEKDDVVGELGDFRVPPGSLPRVRGVLKVWSRWDGTATVLQDSILVPRELRNGALHGDSVVVEVGVTKPTFDAQYEDEEHNDDGETDTKRIPTKIGRVVEIVARNADRTVVVATWDEDAEIRTVSRRSDGATTYESRFIPMDARLPFLDVRFSLTQLGEDVVGNHSADNVTEDEDTIKTRIVSLLRGNRCLVALDFTSSSPTSRFPKAKLRRVVGPALTPSVESLCLIHETGLQNHELPFPKAALGEVPLGDDVKSLPTAFSTPREDMRDRFVLSIDPLGCRDIDDAMSIRRIDFSPATTASHHLQSYEVGVHIADVAAFVLPNSALDSEARARCTTVYLEERRLDMLPSPLCEILCSLRPGVDRFAVSVIWRLELDTRAGGEVTVKSTRFARTLIYNRFALSYEQAQALVDEMEGRRGEQEEEEEENEDERSLERRGWTGKPLPLNDEETMATIKSSVMDLVRLSRALRRRRGGLALEAREEVKFALDPATREPVRMRSVGHAEIHDSVAEMMIFANAAVGEEILRRFPSQAVLRRHASARAERFEGARKVCEEGLGVRFDASSARALAETLGRASRVAPLETVRLLSSLVARGLDEAEYVCAGATGGGAGGGFVHFGLGLEVYTHFTSPIRRYADLVVARMLIAGMVESSSSSSSPSKFVEEKVFSATDEEIRHNTGEDAEEDEEDWMQELVMKKGKEVKERSPSSHDTIRAPARLEESEGLVPSPSRLDEICSRINSQHRKAKNASRRSEELFFFLLLYSRETAAGDRSASLSRKTVRGVISEVDGERGLVGVYLPEVDAKLPLRLRERGSVSSFSTRSERISLESLVVSYTSRHDKGGDDSQYRHDKGGDDLSRKKTENAFVISVLADGGESQLEGVLRVATVVEVEVRFGREEGGKTPPRIPQPRLVLVVDSLLPLGYSSLAPGGDSLREVEPRRENGEATASTTRDDYGRYTTASQRISLPSTSPLFRLRMRLELRDDSESPITPDSLPITTLDWNGKRKFSHRIRFGGFHSPPSQLLRGGGAEGEEVDEEYGQRASENLMGLQMRPSSTLLTAGRLREAEREAMRRMQKLQAEKYDARVKRRIKKSKDGG